MFGTAGKYPRALWPERGSLGGAEEGAALTLWGFFMTVVTLIHIWNVCSHRMKCDTPNLLLCFVTSPFLQGAEIVMLQVGGRGEYQAPGASEAGVPRQVKNLGSEVPHS